MVRTGDGDNPTSQSRPRWTENLEAIVEINVDQDRSLIDLWGFSSQTNSFWVRVILE